MKQPKIRGKYVLDRLYAYLKDEIKFSNVTLSKHRKNWEKACEFASEKGISVDFTDENSVRSLACRLALNSRLVIEANHSLPYSITLIVEYVKYGTIYTTISSTDFTGVMSQEVIQYLAVKKSEHLSVSSYRQYELQLSRFLNFLHSKGINSIESLTPAIVRLYIMELKPEHRSNVYIAVLMVKRFLQWLYDNRMIKTNIAIKIPNAKTVQQSYLPSVYSKEEISILLSKVDRGNPTGKRDYLALILASHLGMRSSDICDLKFENIDWEVNTINMVQRKTDQPLSLPLLPEVGNAIIDYLKEGRPESTDPHVLLNASPPFAPMRSATIYQITSQAFKRAGIDVSTRKHGAHSLRHSLASRMLENQTSMPVISEALGHTDTNSTMHYLRVDITSLQSCQMETILVDELFYLQFC